MPGMQTILKSIHPSSVKGKGDVRNASLRSAQPLFLQYHDGRDPDAIEKGAYQSYKEEKLYGMGQLTSGISKGDL